MKLTQPSPLYVDGFLLRILDSAYLVQVEPANGKTGRYEDPANLPDWIFKSAHAIWLSQEEGPMLERATKGDQVKRQLMQIRRKQ
jgi:hypothetical protein